MNALPRKIVPYKNYFLDFYEQQTETVQKRIEWMLHLIQTVPRIPEVYFKHISGTQGLYEIRIESGSNTFRIFTFFDDGNLIVLGNGFQKKTQKTPAKEIAKALKIKENYFYEKSKKRKV